MNHALLIPEKMRRRSSHDTSSFYVVIMKPRTPLRCYIQFTGVITNIQLCTDHYREGASFVWAL